MSKISILQREKKRYFLFNKYYLRYMKIKNSKNLNRVNFEFQKLPRNSNPTRIKNRCYISGRPRGVFRRFGLSRLIIKSLSSKGFIPGLFKSSW